MDYQSVQLRDEPLTLVSPAEVAQLEAQLGTPLPQGYHQYMTTLGVGVLNDTVRVFSPFRIAHEFQDYRVRWDEYWLWEDGTAILPKTKALECIIVADTGNGDDLLFHPAQPDTLYLLPADQSIPYRFENGLDEALTWLLNWDELFSAEDEDERPDGLYFEPFPPEA